MSHNNRVLIKQANPNHRGAVLPSGRQRDANSYEKRTTTTGYLEMGGSSGARWYWAVSGEGVRGRRGVGWGTGKVPVEVESRLSGVHSMALIWGGE